MKTSLSAEYIYEHLKGEWAISREITGSDRSVEAIAYGKSNFSSTSSCTELIYRENGVISWTNGNTETNFIKSYRYLFDRESIYIYFADGYNSGSLFLHLALNESQHGIMASAEHKCADDLYVGTYFFYDKGHFMINFRVLGPRKNYVIQTQFHKIYSQ